jgi:hypothetical protein
MLRTVGTEGVRDLDEAANAAHGLQQACPYFPRSVRQMRLQVGHCLASLIAWCLQLSVCMCVCVFVCVCVCIVPLFVYRVGVLTTCAHFFYRCKSGEG